MSFHIELPVPPSTNQLFVNVSAAMRAKAKKPLPGRVKTKAYKDWRKNAVLSIYAQVRADRRVGGLIEVTIRIPEDCKPDADNLIKAILDSLVASNRIDDDRNVWRIDISRARTRPGMVLVTVFAANVSAVAA